MKRKILTAIMVTVAVFLFAFKAKAETVTVYGSSSIISISFVPTNGVDPAITYYTGSGTFDIPDGLYYVVFQMQPYDSNIGTAHMEHDWTAWNWDPYTNTSYQASASDTAYPDTDTSSSTYGQIRFNWCQVGDSNNNVFYFYAY